jgi:N6-L-threonylcarbamoyladenine synthase
MSKHILAIETSCDDTSIALYKDKELLSIADASSMKEYGKYGGIIPELAARNHEEYINRVFNDCIKKAKIKTDMITHIAYTSEPGLPGSLHVGKVFAKTLSFLLNKPLIPINHMMGHAFSYAIDNPKLIKFPLLSLVISGGNTILYKFDSLTKYEIINETNDDAVGECLDKIGRALGLPYPGGISLDKTYKYSRNIKTIPHQDFKKPFSFSGIKSFATNYVNTSKLKKQKLEPTKIGSACLK